MLKVAGMRRRAHAARTRLARAGIEGLEARLLLTTYVVTSAGDSGPGTLRDAITQANLIGKIAVTGLSTPNQMKPFVKSGCVKSVILWNPVDLGYAAIYAMRAVVDGKLKPGDTELDAGRLGKLKLINGSQFLLGPPFIFNQDNIDKFDF